MVGAEVKHLKQEKHLGEDKKNLLPGKEWDLIRAK